MIGQHLEERGEERRCVKKHRDVYMYEGEITWSVIKQLKMSRETNVGDSDPSGRRKELVGKRQVSSLR